MFDWVLNTPLMLSNNVIWHAYWSTADNRFSDLVYDFYVFSMLKIRNRLTKAFITKRLNILLQMQKTELSLLLF